MASHNETGKKGEALAAQFLETKGYEILVRNYRYKRAEVDLIAAKDKCIVFVEVKTRNRIDYGNPESFVSDKKIELLRSAAEEYIFTNDWHDPIRFDIISVQLAKSTKIEHFEDAFA